MVVLAEQKPTIRRYAVNDSTINAVPTPDAHSNDPLTDLLRSGAKELIKQAVEAELSSMLSHYSRQNHHPPANGGACHHKNSCY